jgi:uncharacterized protein (TIGR00299 family) protein
MGAAGDMLSAALLELHPAPEAFVERLNQIGIPGVKIKAEPAQKCGVSGTYFSVEIGGEHEGEHHHHEHGHSHHGSGLGDITELIGELAIPEEVKVSAVAVYNLIAEAESKVHGKPVEQIHFHEVGTLDAVADIVSVCLLIHELAPKCILASPVVTGFGSVHCAHGELPVPAPATELLLRGIPIQGGDIQSELCTPTGAALLRHFVSEFKAMPPMRVQKTGYGMGRKDFPRANCLRAFLGEAEDNSGDLVYELCCNLDDMTPEALALAQQILMESGALDVYTAPIVMKKGRLGSLLSCLCPPQKKEELVALIFKHTSTIGIRETAHKRYILSRRKELRQTPFGELELKISSGYGVQKSKPEFEHIANIVRDL